MENNTLEELQESLTKIEQMIKFSKLYGGKIDLDGELITTAELEDLREDLKFNIASKISEPGNLKIVK